MAKERNRTNAHNLQAQSIMLTVNGVAALLACSPRTVYRLVDREKIPRPVRIGGMIRWPRAGFEQWVGDGCPIPAEVQCRHAQAMKSYEKN